MYSTDCMTGAYSVIVLVPRFLNYSIFMDFARKLLGKYGWKDGDGLGKNSNGIAKPLRATLKFDNAGFGVNQAESDFNNHWWERVFNDAANNVEVKQNGETIKMALKSQEDSVEISTKGYSVKKLKKAKKRNAADNGYDNFMKASTLTSLGSEIENPDRIETGDIEVTKVKMLTDEELFKACGGRTAHKGARHGLKLSGKLLRIERQEQELLAQMTARINAGEVKESATKQTENVKDLKKKKKRRLDDHNDCPKNTETPECRSNHVKKKKRKQIAEESEEPSIAYDETNNEGVQSLVKKKKKKHHETNISETFAVQESEKVIDGDDNEESSIAVENIKKKRKCRNKNASRSI